MGCLARGEEVWKLPRRCVVGRSALAQLRLRGRQASAEHAVLFWKEGCWQVRDLSSTNGTFVNGVLLVQQRPVALKRGDVLRFGDQDEIYGLADDGEPGPSAVHLSTGERLWGSGDILFLPSEEEPEASIFRKDSAWVMDVRGDQFPLQTGETVELGRGVFRVELGECRASNLCPTTSLAHVLDIESATLEFVLSPGEEHIDLKILYGKTCQSVGVRSFNALLLLLARQRLEDEAPGEEPLAISNHGWVNVAWVAEVLAESIEKVNLDVHRARASFAKCGVAEAHRIVERRPHQMRIGVAQLRLLME